jgi:hypothetical protein
MKSFSKPYLIKTRFNKNNGSMNKKKNRFPAAVCQVNDGAWVAS